MSGVLVVGVDGSEGSVRALRFALREAALRGAVVRAVSVWHVPAALYAEPFGFASYARRDYEQAARGRLRSAIERALSAAPGVPIESVVREGDAAEVLQEEALRADVLVVGARGLGGFRGLLLGSVSRRCVERAGCALVVVPPGAAGCDAPVEQASDEDELPFASDYEREPVLLHEP